VGLEPACVIVCPVEAIIAGDLDDPTTKISNLIQSEFTQVRKPEALTLPKLHYIEADQSALVPTEQSHSAGYLWAQQQLDPVFHDQQALADAEARARTTYDISHERPWGWKVSAYLWTKSVAAGAFSLAALAMGLDLVPNHWLFDTAAPQVSLLFLVVTVALLVADLKRPERFLYILIKPQWRSWLVIGGYILVIYGALLTVWMTMPMLGLRQELELPVMWVGGIFALMAAVYSAFLFRQARGRVFWHSPLTAVHLIVQAMVAGAAVLLVVDVVTSLVTGGLLHDPAFDLLYYQLVGSLVAHGVLIAGEFLAPENNVEKVRAAGLITRGIFAKWFWSGVVLTGVVIPVMALVTGLAQIEAVSIITSLLALAGLFVWEHIWIQAGQAVPLS
jgi:formate-dependent nitrite reductase membrane component NrfD